MTKRNRKRVYSVLFIGVLFLNAFFTFQSAEGTVRLSEGLRIWLEQFGFRSDFHSFRSNAHLVMFFMIGLSLGLLGREMEWTWKQVLFVGFLLSILDEGIKCFLPTREFDCGDLIRNMIGMLLAFTILALKPNNKRQFFE